MNSWGVINFTAENKTLVLFSVGSDVGGAAYDRDTHNMPDAVSFNI